MREVLGSWFCDGCVSIEMWGLIGAGFVIGLVAANLLLFCGERVQHARLVVRAVALLFSL